MVGRHWSAKKSLVVAMALLFLILQAAGELFSPSFSLGAIATESKGIKVSDEEQDLLEKGEVIVRELKAEREGVQTFEALGLVEASGEEVVAVLQDFIHYPEFMPNVDEVEIVERRKGATIMNYVLGLPLGKVKKYRLQLTDLQKSDTLSSLSWSLVEWPGLKPEETIRDTSGYWMVQELSVGQSIVLYHVSTDPGDIPFGLGWIVDIMSKQSVPEAVISLRTRAGEATQ